MIEQQVGGGGEQDWMAQEAKDIAARIAGGEDVVSRIVTMDYFGYNIEGEEVIFTDELRAEVERVAGAKLVESAPVEFPMDRVLQFAESERAGVQERLGA